MANQSTDLYVVERDLRLDLLRGLGLWMIFLYPIDKTDLDMLRFSHFLALAVVVSRYLNRDWAGLKSMWLRPLVLSGQHSLPLFCLGVFLSFGAHWILVQWKP